MPAMVMVMGAAMAVVVSMHEASRVVSTFFMEWFLVVCMNEVRVYFSIFGVADHALWLWDLGKWCGILFLLLKSLLS